MGTNDFHDYYSRKDLSIEYKFISKWIYQFSSVPCKSSKFTELVVREQTMQFLRFSLVMRVRSFDLILFIVHCTMYNTCKYPIVQQLVSIAKCAYDTRYSHFVFTSHYSIVVYNRGVNRVEISGPVPPGNVFVRPGSARN